MKSSKEYIINKEEDSFSSITESEPKIIRKQTIRKSSEPSIKENKFKIIAIKKQSSGQLSKTVYDQELSANLPTSISKYINQDKYQVITLPKAGKQDTQFKDKLDELEELDQPKFSELAYDDVPQFETIDKTKSDEEDLVNKRKIKQDDKPVVELKEIKKKVKVIKKLKISKKTQETN